jgi:hypothetical protein
MVKFKVKGGLTVRSVGSAQIYAQEMALFTVMHCTLPLPETPPAFILELIEVKFQILFTSCNVYEEALFSVIRITFCVQ